MACPVLLLGATGMTGRLAARFFWTTPVAPASSPPPAGHLISIT